jgi:hypothetical protein
MLGATGNLASTPKTDSPPPKDKEGPIWLGLVCACAGEDIIKAAIVLKIVVMIGLNFMVFSLGLKFDV